MLLKGQVQSGEAMRLAPFCKVTDLHMCGGASMDRGFQMLVKGSQVAEV